MDLSLLGDPCGLCYPHLRVLVLTGPRRFFPEGYQFLMPLGNVTFP